VNTKTQFFDEVAKGDRFEFGKNWSRFLSTLNDTRIKVAEDSLKDNLGVNRLDGKTFLDIGSGSGLFSLAARRLGATVHSFDYDINSVGCTTELRRRYFNDDPRWTVEHGSVLDKEYLSKFEQHDIVYSWGVLHHTGSMWEALENVKPLVKKDGTLFIAIYNDVGPVSEMWARVKRIYNGLPSLLRLPFAMCVIAAAEFRPLLSHLRRGKLGEYINQWTQYAENSTRGMSKWHDWIDWIGGHPYEYATIEVCADYFLKDGFRLDKVVDRSAGYGCNEFVFRKVAELGIQIDQRLPASSWLSRRFGNRLEKFEQVNGSWQAKIAALPKLAEGQQYFVVNQASLLGAASERESSTLKVLELNEAVAKENLLDSCRVVPAWQKTMSGPFASVRRNCWLFELPELEDQSDMIEGNSSTLFLFEDGEQLPYPHSIHDSIMKYGAGRFSHWGKYVYFSTSDNSDPNANGRKYEVLWAEQTQSE